MYGHQQARPPYPQQGASPAAGRGFGATMMSGMDLSMAGAGGGFGAYCGFSPTPGNFGSGPGGGYGGAGCGSFAGANPMPAAGGFGTFGAAGGFGGFGPGLGGFGTGANATGGFGMAMQGYPQAAMQPATPQNMAPPRQQEQKGSGATAFGAPVPPRGGEKGGSRQAPQRSQSGQKGGGFGGQRSDKNEKGGGAFGAFGSPGRSPPHSCAGWSYGQSSQAKATSTGCNGKGKSGKNGSDAMQGPCGKGFGGMGRGSGGHDAEPQPKKELYIGNLPEDMTSDKLRGAFEVYGRVKSVYVQHGRNFGFVEYSNPEDATTAIARMAEQSVLVVKYANSKDSSPNDRWSLPHSNVYVANLPGNITENSLKEKLEVHGGVQSCVLKTDVDSGKTYGFVKFQTTGAAARAIEAYDGHAEWIVKSANSDNSAAGGKAYHSWKGAHRGCLLKGWGNWGYDYSGGAKELDRPEGEPSDNLYVRDLPPGISEEEVMSAFSAEGGQVLECRVLRYDGLSACSALVRMATMEQAVRAKALLNNTVPESCKSFLSVKPQEKNGVPVENHVYITGIHYSATKAQLDEVFGKYGHVKWSKLMPPSMPSSYSGGTPMSVALVEYDGSEQCAAAIQALHNRSCQELGTPMVVRFADSKSGERRAEPKPNNNLYVKGWPVGFPDFLLQQTFQKHGNVVRVRLLDNPDPDQATSAALVQMSRVDEATNAMRSLHGRTVALDIPPMSLKHAGKDRRPGDSLYVTSLPRTITEVQVRETFQKYGEILRLRLLKHHDNAEAHAVVQLSSQELAAAAMREAVSKFGRGPWIRPTCEYHRDVPRPPARAARRQAAGV